MPPSHLTLRTALAAVALVVASASGAAAQLAERKILTLAGAKLVAAAASDAARKANAPGGAIAVVDDGGHLLYLERLDGTFAASADISVGKARTAMHFRKPTSAFEEIIRSGRTPMIALTGALGNFTPLQGGVPIEVGGTIVGAVGVSGAASAQQDEELARAGAAAIK